MKSELDCGLYTYRVQPIYLKDKNADEVFRKLKQKQDNGEAFTEDDYAALSLTPLMSGKMSSKDMFKEAIRLAKPNIELSAEKTTAMLYTLADKFLNMAVSFLIQFSYIFYLFISLYCTIFLIFPTRSNVSTMVTILNGIFI